MDLVLFLTFALIAVACAINMSLQRHPVSSALSLIGVMVSLAVLYVLLGAEFIAAAQPVLKRCRRKRARRIFWASRCW
jgi:NADH-quinone oxidoreductase subunit J